jgi:hypothetical protein
MIHAQIGPSTAARAFMMALASARPVVGEPERGPRVRRARCGLWEMACPRGFSFAFAAQVADLATGFPCAYEALP